MVEALIETLTTTSIMSGLPDAKTVLEHLPKWFDEYDEWAPHKRLRMKSSRQFRAA